MRRENSLESDQRAFPPSRNFEIKQRNKQREEARISLKAEVNFNVPGWKRLYLFLKSSLKQKKFLDSRGLNKRGVYLQVYENWNLVALYSKRNSKCAWRQVMYAHRHR